MTHSSLKAIAWRRNALLPSLLHGISTPSFCLLFIIVLGAAYRFLDLGSVRHGYDEGYQAYDALRMLDGRQLLRIGQPSSIFLDNPPLMAYLQAIPLFFWRSLWSVYLFITALNTAAIWFVYQAVKRLSGVSAALLAAFLFAVNPWVVHFSRMPWTQGLLPLFMAIIAWGLWPVMVGPFDRRQKGGGVRHVFLAMLAITAMTQTYVLGFVILLPVSILSLLFYRHIPKRPFYAGVVVFVASLILYAAGLSARAEPNVTKLEAFATDNEYSVNWQSLEHAVRFVTGLDYDGQGIQEGEQPARHILTLGVHYLLSIALLAGGIRAFRALVPIRSGNSSGAGANDNRIRRLSTVLLVWFLTPIIGFLLFPYLVHPHYLMLSLPAGHVLAAWGILPLFHRLRLVTLLLMAAIATLFGLNLHRASLVVAANPSGYGFNEWALSDISRIGATIRELATGDVYPRLIYAEDNPPLLSSISATYVETMPELAFPHFLLLPAQTPLLYVLINHAPESALLGPLQESFPERTIHIADGTSVSFLRVLPYDRDQAMMLPQTVVDWTSDAGLTLLGYSLEPVPAYRAGQPLAITAYWRVEGLHEDRAEWLVNPFFHVLNPEWQIVVNESPDGQWGYRWQLGDVYIQHVTLLLPDYLEPGEYQLSLGLFDPIHGNRFNLNSPAGVEPTYLIPFQVAS